MCNSNKSDYNDVYKYISTDSPLFTHRRRGKNTAKIMKAVAAMAMVLMILLSANMDTISVAAQGVNCYDNCNTGCAGLPSDEYLICDKKCHEFCGDESKIDGNLVESAKMY